MNKNNKHTYGYQRKYMYLEKKDNFKNTSIAFTCQLKDALCFGPYAMDHCFGKPDLCHCCKRCYTRMLNSFAYDTCVTLKV